MEQREMVDLGNLKPRSRDVSWINEKGIRERYVVREASARAATEYRNMQESASRYENGKYVGTERLSDCEPYIVGQCVFAVDDRGGASPSPVGTVTVNGWPDRIQTTLFEIVKDLTPTLNPNDTPESLQKRIDQLARKREFLLELRRATSPNVPAPGTPGDSGSAGSSEKTSTS